MNVCNNPLIKSKYEWNNGATTTPNILNSPIIGIYEDTKAVNEYNIDIKIEPASTFANRRKDKETTGDILDTIFKGKNNANGSKKPLT